MSMCFGMMHFHAKASATVHFDFDCGMPDYVIAVIGMARLVPDKV